MKTTAVPVSVIDGVTGALPPVIGWAAATGDIGPEPLILLMPNLNGNMMLPAELMNLHIHQ
jgi:hypothetical protein